MVARWSTRIHTLMGRSRGDRDRWGCTSVQGTYFSRLAARIHTLGRCGGNNAGDGNCGTASVFWTRYSRRADRIHASFFQGGVDGRCSG